MMPDAPAPTALNVLELAQNGRFADIHDLYAPPLRPMVPAEALQATWDAEIGRVGPVSSVGTPVSEQAGPGATIVRVPVTCERGAFTLVASVTDNGWLTGLQLASPSAAEPAAPWQAPDYVDPERFAEEEVTVGTGPLAVPGTLTLPRSPRMGQETGRRTGTFPGPAVVLLSGSGAHDRDETLGRNKPFRDLAWGLASRGVTVLRFDKVTYAHGPQVAKDRDFTVADEYLPDAVAAAGLLRQHPAVDPQRVFVLGHSLGGTIAPRVALAEPSIAGLVILAGGTQPMHWAAVRQTRYLASLVPETAAAAQPVIEALTRQAATVDSPALSPSTPDSELPFGVPAPYWLDLRGYDPAAAAATLGMPMLILQGGRDYQVTLTDDLARWEASLAGHPDVTIRVYEADNHLFFRGTGKPSPAEYEPAQHVDPAVIADIADWLLTTGAV
jgi:dienelactone hydrolase